MGGLNMNEEFVINLVSKHLDKQNKISESTFNQIFAALNSEQKQSVRSCLHKYGIAVGYEKGVVQNKTQVIKEEKKQPKTSDYTKQHALKNLSNEQLCVLHQQGNELALTCLVENNQNMVWSRVAKYSKRYRHKLDEEDLVAFGNIGLLKAADKYDVYHENKFMTYAIYWIDQMIMRSIADFGFTIRIPIHVFEAINKVLRLKRQHLELSREQFYELLSEEGISREKYDYLMMISENILSISSLNCLVGENEETELGDFVPNLAEESIEEIVERQSLRSILDEILEGLSYREKEIIRLRFGLVDGVPRTLQQVGKVFGISRERIRQIESKALKRLRHPSRAKKIKDYIVK